MKRRTILQAGLGFALGRPLLAALERNELEAAAEVLRQATSAGQVEASTLYVRQADREFAKSFGAATTVDAVFLLASISKPLTVAGLMTLFDAGEFALDDPVRRFIPEFRGEDRDQITLRQLLTHCSGLPDQLPENAKLRAAHAPLSEFVAAAIRTPLLFTPGKKYGYSSMAILLAGEVAARISGKPIAELLSEVVFQRLQMKHSALGVGRLNPKTLIRCQLESAAPESGSGDPNTKSWDWNSDYWRQLGAPWGGAHGSAGDLGQFLHAFLHPRREFLKPETVQLMIRNQNSPGIRPRGLGFDLGSGLGGPQNSDSVFGHTGSTGTLCWADPFSDSICVVLTTLPGGAVDPHPRSIASRHVADAVGGNGRRE